MKSLIWILIASQVAGITPKAAYAAEPADSEAVISNAHREVEITPEDRLIETALKSAAEIEAGASTLMLRSSNPEDLQYAANMNALAAKIRSDAFQPDFKERLLAKADALAQATTSSAPRDGTGCAHDYLYTISGRMKLTPTQTAVVAVAALPAFIIYLIMADSSYVDPMLALVFLASAGVALGVYGIFKLYNRIKSRHDRDALATLDQAYALKSGTLTGLDNLRRLKLRINIRGKDYTLEQVGDAVIGANESKELCPQGVRPLIKDDFRKKIQEWLEKTPLTVLP